LSLQGRSDGQEDMARGKRKKADRAAVEEEDDDEEEEDEVPAGAKTWHPVEVEFEFFDPDEKDFHSVRDLLTCGSGTLNFSEIDFSGLADSIVGQVNIGTMIKSGSGEGIDGDEEDDATICCMLTALNLRQFAKLEWVKALKTLLAEKAKKFGGPETEGKLQAILEAKPAKSGKSTEVGLLVSERFVNVPMELIPALHKAMLEDIVWSCDPDNCEDEEERRCYFFTHFLCIARCVVANPSASSSSRGPVPVQGGPGIAFLRPEDEAYARAASFCFSFPLPAPKESETPTLETGAPPQRKKRKASAKASAAASKGPQERRAVFGLTRQAFEKVAAGLRKSLSEVE